MKSIYGTTIFVQILFLTSHLPRSCCTESTATDKSSKQTNTAKTTQKTEGAKPQVAETTQKPTTKQRTSEETRKSRLLESSQWNTRALKSTDFTTQEPEDAPKPCKPVTVLDIIKRRKEAYRLDPSVMNFVSAYPLPVNETSLKEDNCRIQARRSRAKKAHKPRAQGSSPTPQPQPAPTPAKVDNQPQNAKRPCREGETAADECDINNRLPDPGPYDYVSSIEYYDDDAIHDIKDCPNDLEMITLDLQELRQYDFQCEVLTKWTGLD